MSTAFPNTVVSSQPRFGNSWRPSWEMFGSVRTWWVICICCAAFFAWAARHSMNPDGLSYLDLASAAIQGGPSKLLSDYWSPGYPALFALMLFVFRPSPNLEFPVTHFMNLLVFVCALWTFTGFVRNWSKVAQGNIDNKQTYAIPFAYATFLWFMLRFIGVEGVNPDLCIAAIVFLIAGVTCRLYLPQAALKHYVILGLALGVGYYFKSAMLPLSGALIVLLFILPPYTNGLSRSKLPLSLGTFVIVVLPLLGAMSLRAHKLSFGETGRLNYLWFVNGRQWWGGMEPPEPNAIREHPAPKLLDKPLTLDFRSPVGGTYPAWYEPSYWYRETKTQFSIRQQVKAIGVNVKAYKEMIFDSMAYVAGAIVLFALSGLGRSRPRVLWWQAAWPLAAFVMYALVTVENRYVGAFYILFWLAVYGALIPRVDRVASGAVLATVLCAAMIPFIAHVAMIGGRAALDLVHRRPPEYQTAGRALQQLGLQHGDQLAVVGYAHNSYYARYAGLRVVAQIPDTREFWQLSLPELKNVEERLAAIGVKAILAPNRPEAAVAENWKDVQLSDSDRLSILVLPTSVKLAQR